MALRQNSTYAYVDLTDTQVFVDTPNLADRSDWSDATSYALMDVVLYLGALYVCLTANTNIPPSFNVTDEWSTLVLIREGPIPPPSGYILDGTRVIRDYHVAWGTNVANNEVGAHSMPYHSDVYTTVSAALDALFYVTPAVTSFTNSVGSAEIGSSVPSVTLVWAYNVPVVSQSINNGIGSLPASTRSTVATGPYTTAQSWVLSASDGTTPVSASTSLTFLNKRYWGVSALTSLNDAQVIALNKELSATRVQSRTFAPSGQYLYFAWPTSFGTPIFTVNGLVNTAWTKVTRAFVNASGFSTSYDIYRSNNLLTGTFVVAVS